MHAVTTIANVIPIRFHADQCAPLAPNARPSQCSACHLKDLCLPTGLEDADLGRLDGMMFGRRRVREGQSLYREGEPFQYLYAVRSGTFKSSVVLLDGREQVTGFQMAGELLALDGFASGRQGSSAVALEDAEVCSIPFDQLTRVASASAGMQQILARLMSRADIGSYLGMKLETVSRTLSSFHQQGWISVDKKHLCILDFEGLAGTVETRLQ